MCNLCSRSWQLCPNRPPPRPPGVLRQALRSQKLCRSFLRKVAASESPPNWDLTVLGQKPPWTITFHHSRLPTGHHGIWATCSAQALCPLQACAGHFLQEAPLALGQVPCWSFTGSEFLLHSFLSDPPVRLRAWLEQTWVCVHPTYVQCINSAGTRGLQRTLSKEGRRPGIQSPSGMCSWP